jgi:hypothetical protein
MELVTLSISIVGLATHLIWAANRLLDLYTKSKRGNKFQWTLFILLVPVIGILTYNLTMRRHKFSGKTMIF